MSDSNRSHNKTSRNYVFTMHIPRSHQGNADIAQQWIREYFMLSQPSWASLKFMVYQLELGQEGSYHLQGYLELNSSQRITWIRNTWTMWEPGSGYSTHLEPRFGSRQEAIDYCQKEETRIAGPWSYGSTRGQGSRSDLSLVATAVLERMPLNTIMSTYPTSYLRYGKHIKSMACDVLKSIKVDWHPIFIVFWGEPDTGKTFTCRYLAPNAYEFMNQHGNSIWWDGYEGQDDIIFSDFGKGALPFRDFKTLWDNGCQVNVKGGTTRLMPKRVWISSNTEPALWYPSIVDPLDRAALYRRITYCYKWTGSHLLDTVMVLPYTKPDSRSLTCPRGELWRPREPPVHAPPGLDDLPLRLNQPAGPNVLTDSTPSTADNRVVVVVYPPPYVGPYASPSPIREEETGSTDSNSSGVYFPTMDDWGNFNFDEDTHTWY